MSTYFISDIHLHQGSELQSELLLNFIKTYGTTADAIYILGDLFSLWLGDDLNEDYSLNLIAALQDLRSKNIPVYFMRGNRDFLVGKNFCETSGCILLKDPHIIKLNGCNTLLTHGDLLCTADVKYQYFRRVVQNKFVKKLFLNLPISIRKKLGFWIKHKTKNKSSITTYIYDVIPTSVAEWFKKYDVQLIIHGHTHKPGIHKYDSKTRIVLGDWNNTSAHILCYSNETYELLDLLAAPRSISIET